MKLAYGRIYVKDQDVFTRLSPLAFKVYGMACLHAWRNGGPRVTPNPIGVVPMSIRALSKLVGSNEKSVRRVLPQLASEGLITYEDGRITIVSYLEDAVLMPAGGAVTMPAGVRASCPPVSAQPQLPIELPAGSEVSEVYQRKRRGAKPHAAAKPPPPFHPLRAHVRWDKSAVGLQLVIDPGGITVIRDHLAKQTEKYGYARQLTDEDLNQSQIALNRNLVGNPHRQGVNLVHAVFAWFAEDIARKNNHPQRGKPLAQRVDEKTIERMKDDGIEESGTEISSLGQQLLESGNLRFNR